jgi:hypothetical protein
VFFGPESLLLHQLPPITSCTGIQARRGGHTPRGASMSVTTTTPWPKVTGTAWAKVTGTPDKDTKTVTGTTGR